MKAFTHFFIDHPVFASVASILIVLLGGFAYVQLPVAQYPEIAPPTITVSAVYPGASAETVAETLATPLEQEINGVENMLYMTSQSTSDGAVSISIAFEIGTDLDTAQVLVQNRVAIAEPRLPEAVRRQGIVVQKRSPDIMMVIHMTSPDGSRDQLYLSNYATLQVRDVLARIDGVGDVLVFGQDYAMRIWLDPDLLAARNLTAGDAVAAVRGQNVQVAAGVLNQPPVPTEAAYELTVETQGRLVTPREFENIIVRTDALGRVTLLDDVARVEVGAQTYSQTGYLDDRQAVPMLIFQRPGSNALETAADIQTAMATLAAEFPPGVAFEIVYNPTDYVAESVDAVFRTLFEAAALVILVIVLFLQSWRASIIPIIAIPVSLIGTFALMAVFGFSLNTLTLFGLVLAIGIVVDDAIVVVENVERQLRAGLSPRDAARRTMEEVSGALIATTLVLIAVFVPASLMSGITGQFMRQFALTIATATVVSTFVSLTLSPALCALVFKPDAETQTRQHSPLTWPFRAFFGGFNWLFDRLAGGYGGLTRRLVRLPLIVLPIYAGLVVLSFVQFERAPTGFIPDQDQGYLITVVQLPPGAALYRTEEVVQRASAILRGIDGVEHTVGFAGFDGATFTNASNAGVIFSTLTDYGTRPPSFALIGQFNQALFQIQEGFLFTLPPPPVPGVGSAGGFKLMILDQRARGLETLEAVTQDLVAEANRSGLAVGAFSLFNTRTPRIYADLDRVRAEMLGVSPDRLFETIEIYLGSAYINDFTFLGRSYRVTAQADGAFRQDVDDIADLRTRNAAGEMVPIGSVATFHDTTGPQRVERHNLFDAAAIQGTALPGRSTGETLIALEQLAEHRLPDGFGYAWTELSLQERLATGGLEIFLLSVVFVFLVLAAQYESWSLPLSVILIVPMGLLAGVSGLLFRGMSVDILGQVAFVVLVGLAAKNAILIVEFARQAEQQGKDRFAAAAEAARTRLRPVLMTALSFILGVVPLVVATGAGSEMRQALGTAVFAGMIGVTVFGLIFMPAFYTGIRGVVAWLGRDRSPRRRRRGGRSG